jgi:tetratricopeptide (TPR) repeat protein
MRKKRNKKHFTFLVAILIFAFLFLNLLYSQLISPLYPQFVNESKNTVVEYLKKIKTLSSFEIQLNVFENIYGRGIKEEVFQEDLVRNQKIKKLEQVLEKNPNSRDVLYSLYQLYWEKGDSLTAGKYLKLIKEVDPNIGL